MTSKEAHQPEPPSSPDLLDLPDTAKGWGAPQKAALARPASYDALLKALFKRYAIDLTTWLLGERTLEVVELDTAHAEVQTRFSDKFFRVRLAQRGPVLMHIELQMAGDPDMPSRMAGYTGLLAKTLQLAEKEGLKPASVVVYLHEESYREDPGLFQLEGELGFAMAVRYKVIKLWERSPDSVLEMESPGLTPLVPLMAGNPDELLVKSVEKIRKTPETLASHGTKRELLTVLGALASKVIKNKELLRKVRSEIWIMGDNWFLDEVRDEGMQVGLVKGRAEGREEGREEGARQASLEDLWTVLNARFGDVPAAVQKRIEARATLADLRELIRLAASCPNLEVFLSAAEKG